MNYYFLKIIIKIRKKGKINERNEVSEEKK